MYKSATQYFDEHLKDIFSHKEVKNNKKELLRELLVLLEKIKLLIPEDDALLSVLVVESYKNYKELSREVPRLKNVYNEKYHYTYIHASYIAGTSFYEDDSYLNQIEEELVQYHRKYDSQFDGMIPKSHYQHLVKLAFLNEKIGRLGIEKKKLKNVSPEEYHLLKAKDKEKALIY